MDLHVPNDGPVTLRVRDRSRAVSRTARGAPRPMTARSDTAKRHMLSRQKQIIDDDEHHGNILKLHKVTIQLEHALNLFLLKLENIKHSE